jgi:hypothetical protein
MDLADGHVVKRFRSRVRGEPEREWPALNVLAEFAPGLEPAPLSADLDAAPPAITGAYIRSARTRNGAWRSAPQPCAR